MAIALITSVEWFPGPSGGTSASVDTTGATLLVVSLSQYVGGTPTLSDSKGNTWIGLTRRLIGTTAHRLFYAKNPTVGPGHTCTVSGTNIYPCAALLAYSGVDLTAPFDGENGALTSSAPPLATGAITPTQSGALIVSGWSGRFSTTTNPSVGSGLTLRQWENSTAGSVAGAVADLVQVTAASINPSWSWTGTDYVGVSIAAFKPVAGAPPAAVETVQAFVWGPL